MNALVVQVLCLSFGLGGLISLTLLFTISVFKMGRKKYFYSIRFMRKFKKNGNIKYYRVKDNQYGFIRHYFSYHKNAIYHCYDNGYFKYIFTHKYENGKWVNSNNKNDEDFRLPGYALPDIIYGYHKLRFDKRLKKKTYTSYIKMYEMNDTVMGDYTSVFREERLKKLLEQ